MYGKIQLAKNERTQIMKYVDFHTHSSCSDGSMSPEELVRHAKESGLSAIALTDHDTFAGVERAKAEGERIGLTVVTGIEISTVSDGETHILGFDFDTSNKELCEVVEEIQEQRRQNNRRTEKALQDLGFDITLDEVKKYAAGLVGRTHFARAMTDKGYTSSINEAFDLYLAKGRPGHNSVRLLEPVQAVRLIKNAGGKAFLAHLHFTKKTGDDLYRFVKMLKENGLDGIEGYYTEYTDEMHKEYTDLAKRLDLKLSGGTDFHGKGKPKISIGKGFGNLRIPYGLLENILN